MVFQPAGDEPPLACCVGHWLEPLEQTSRAVWRADLEVRRKAIVRLLHRWLGRDRSRWLCSSAAADRMTIRRIDP
jgi:hypothetical protein